MKKWLFNLIAAVIVNICIVAAVPAYAASFQLAHTNDSWDAEKRTAAGTIFRSGAYNNETWTLYATYKGKTIILNSAFNGGTVISNGTFVYYAAKHTGKWYVYKGNLKTGKSKRIAKLANNSHSVSLEGYYNGDLYFIVDVPEGTFKKIRLSTKKIKTLRKNASGTDWVGRYFVIFDGTGAGYSYIDAWDARKSKLRTIVKSPVRWFTTNKYVYYVNIVKGESWYLLSGKTITANIKRYTLKNGKKKTVLKKIRINRILEFDGSHIKYLNQKNVVKTKKW